MAVEAGGGGRPGGGSGGRNQPREAKQRGALTTNAKRTLACIAADEAALQAREGSVSGRVRHLSKRYKVA